MANLTLRNQTLNWEVPVSARMGKNQGDENMILIKRVKAGENGKKWTSKLLDFKINTINKYFKDSETFHMAFSFDEEKVIVVFNPPKGTPFFKLSKNGNGRAINNVHLVDKIYQHFKLDPEKDKYYLKIYYWAKLSGMEIYVITPYDYLTKEPIFEDDNFIQELDKDNK